MEDGMNIYNSTLSSVEFCIYKENDHFRRVSLYPGGWINWASIAPGQTITWDHGDRSKVQFEFRFANHSRSNYILDCAPGVTIRPGMIIFNRIDPPPAKFDVRNQIKHVVVLMLENRSFDNVLGWLYSGQGNRPPSNIPATDPPVFDGLVEKKFFNSRYSPGSPPVYATRGVTKSPVNKQPNPNPKEEYPSFLEQMFGVDLGAWLGKAPKLDKPNMGGFLESYARADGKQPERIMECFSPEQLPVLSKLAKEFAVCDRWFSCLPSETLPNRSFLLAGTSFGRLNNGDQLLEDHDPVPNFAFYSDKRTVFDALHEQGVSWSVFVDMIDLSAEGPFGLLNLRPSLTSMQFWSVGRKLTFARIGYFAGFEKAAKSGTLPAYSFIEPSFLPPFTSDQHPGPLCNMAAGEDLIYRTYQAVSQGPGWPHTLLVVLYDEHGGCYDHVPPPSNAVPPDDSKPQFPYEGFNPFRQLGPRVPAVVVSPFIEAGTVFRAPQGQAEYDHTSVLSTLRDWIFRSGAPPASRWLPSQRVQLAPTLWPILSRTTPRTAPVIARPAKPPVMDANDAAQPAIADAPPTLEQATSLQLGLAIEADALHKLMEASPAGVPQNLDTESWRKLVAEAAAVYRDKAAHEP
jgi:phospholipase C